MRRRDRWLVGAAIPAAAGIAVLAARGYLPHWFRWETFALVLAGFGTLALALATFRLAEEEAQAREDERRQRPRLELLRDEGYTHSHAENETTIYVRLLVRNAVGVRAATGTRVLFDSLLRPGDARPTTFGTPYLGWTSANEKDESVVIFPGAARVLDLGELRLDEGPRFRILLPGLISPFNGLPYDVPQERQYVPTGTPIKLVLGSDEAETQFYVATVYWQSAPYAGKTLAEARAFLDNCVTVTVDETTADAVLA